MSHAEARRRIEFPIMWNRLIAVVEEAAQTLVRTAFGAPTREAGDLSAGVYDAEGRMLAQAVTGTPGHVNSMALTVGHVLARYPAGVMAPGDVFVTNDPWLGTGHLHDVVVVTPVHRAGRVIGFFACTLHVVDIGGRPGFGQARQVYEEGLTLPVMRLAHAGRLDEGLLDLIRANVREPLQVIGDIHSEVAANEVGARRLLAMLEEFGLPDLAELGAHILERSREASLEAIARLPQGTWHSSMTTDGFAEPITLHCTLSVGPNGIDVDFPDPPGIAPVGINVPLCYTQAYATFGVKCAVAPHVPNNAGSLATIRITAPEGTVLNAPRPAPVQSRAVLGQMLPDLVFGCLAQAAPGTTPAESTSRLWSVRMSEPSGARAPRFNVLSFHSGGMGARPAQDGLSATAFPSGVKSMPIEVTEAAAPVLIWRRELRTDSGGAGRQRGGLGQVMEIGSAEGEPLLVAGTFDRVLFPARGRDGGGPGATGRVALDDGTELPSKGTHLVPPGRRLVVEMPGGGGLGDPAARDPALLAEDVAEGRVSAGAAKRDYGAG